MGLRPEPTGEVGDRLNESYNKLRCCECARCARWRAVLSASAPMVATQAAGCHRAAPISFVSLSSSSKCSKYSTDSLRPPIASSEFRLRWAGTAVGLPQHKQAHTDLRRWGIVPMLPQLPATALPPPPPPSQFDDAAALVCRLRRRHPRIVLKRS